MNIFDSLIEKVDHLPKGRMLIQGLEAFCFVHDIQMVVDDGPSVRCGETECSGYFSAESKTLAVATGKPFIEWFKVLLHEYAHGRQWLEDPQGFSKIDQEGEQFFEWVAGTRDLSEPERFRIAQQSLELEADAERRVLKLISKYGFESVIDPKEYAQRGNAYTSFYSYIAETGKWYVVGKEPYTLPEVWGTMPTEIALKGVPLTDELRALYALCVTP